MSQQLALSRRREVEEQITHAVRVEYLAYHDNLTTLPNRSLLSKLLGQSVTQPLTIPGNWRYCFSIWIVFKHINHTFGHEAGDQLLQEVATRLKACLREGDAIARLGGDEFIALLQEVDEGKFAAAVAQKILSTVARPFVLLGQEFRITASIGISIYPKDGLEEQSLIKNAEIAMHRAKEEGKNNFQFYSEGLNITSLERLTLESGLWHALEQKRVSASLPAQAENPQRPDRRYGSVAALAASGPRHSAPMRFIPVAEDTGLMVPIGNWVLSTACQQNMAWQQQGLPPFEHGPSI